MVSSWLLAIFGKKLITAKNTPNRISGAELEQELTCAYENRFTGRSLLIIYDFRKCIRFISYPLFSQRTDRIIPDDTSYEMED